MNIQNHKVIDISPYIHEETAIFPGDTPFTRREILSFDKGHNLRLSSMSTTLHIGSHTDAPSHYHKDGQSIEDRSLDYYLGDCQVIDVCCAKGERIRPENLKQEICSTRVLLKTNSFPNPDIWNSDFNSISAELVDLLAHKQVKLIGIDTPSVDPAQDKDLICHNLLFSNDMAILEGIILNNAAAGHYQLIALPLKIKYADASPVRAVLIKK